MKRVGKKLTALLNAVTFAEAGEHKAAIEYLDRSAQECEPSAPAKERSSDCSPAHDDGLLHHLEDQMVAAAFAEAGELHTAREILQRKPRPRAVLLVLHGDGSDFDAFMYAVNLCERVKADLEVVAFSAGVNANGTEDALPAEQIMSGHMASLSQLADAHGVSCTLTVHAGSTDDHLFPYVQSHKEIAAVIYGSPSTHNQTKDGLGFRRALEAVAAKLSIPLVKVLGRRPVRAHP